MVKHLACVNHSSIKKATYLKEWPIRSSHIGNLSKTISNCILGTVISSVSQKHIICSNFFGWICLPKHSFFFFLNRFLLQQSSSQKATSQNLAYLGILCSVLEKIGETKQVEDERRSGRQRKKRWMDGADEKKKESLINLPQKVRKLCVISHFFVVTILLGNNSYTTGMPVYFPFSGATFVRTMHLWTEQLSM